MQPNPNAQPHIPGLITAAGTTQPPLPATAQPGGQLPTGTLTSGMLPQAQIAPIAPSVPALPQAGSTGFPQAPQVDPAMLAAWAAQQQAAQHTATNGPAQQQQPAAVVPPPGVTVPAAHPNSLPTAIPGLAPATAPAVVPGLNPGTPVAPPAQPAASAAPPATGEPDGISDGNGKDYPEGKPLAEMTDGEKAAYYKWYSRQWETRAKARNDYDALKTKADQFDQLSASTATEVEQRITAARNEGYAAAAAAAATVLVDAHVRAGLQARLQPHQVEALAANLNHQHFLSADGRNVDAAKVTAFVDTVAPAPASPAVTAVPAAMAPAAPATPGALPTGLPVPGQPAQPATGLPRPDLGQGSHAQAPLDKLALGREQAKAFLAGNY